MVRALLAFAVLFCFFYYGIIGLRAVTKKQAWQLTKLLTYSTICSVLSLVVLTTFVILF
jgi:hypothetical protein